jgi:hypothetical protein
VTGVHIAVGASLLAVNLAAGLYGAFVWWRGGNAPGYWPAIRTGQALAVLQAALGGVLLLEGKDPPSLHVMYGLLPLGISFVAEQLRAVSAQVELDHRGLEDAQAVGRLPEAEQHAVVHAIIRREIGVMAAAALVVSVLAARGAGWL